MVRYRHPEGEEICIKDNKNVKETNY